MQIHKRLDTAAVKRLLEAYLNHQISLPDALRLLSLKRSRFFVLLLSFRQNPDHFTLDYRRHTPKVITPETEVIIEQYLAKDHELVANPDIAITTHNYSAVKDQLEQAGIKVSLPTLITRAKQYGYYSRKKRTKPAHEREVITTSTGALLQHDSSYHLWSPYAQNKWHLITSLDDYTRLLVFAALLDRETSWAHIEAVKAVSLTYGVPLEWYTDSLSIFRYVYHGESRAYTTSTPTDGVNPQWKECVIRSGAQVIHALSAQAKGKIERPYRWLQDRVVRTCATEQVKTLAEARSVLQAEVTRYNTRQVHSTTKEIPLFRFKSALTHEQSVWHPFKLPEPYTHLDDIFCLLETRITNPYRKILLWGTEIQLPKVPKQEEVEIHLTPNREHQVIHVRIWWQNQLVYRANHPKQQFPKVQF